MSLLWLQVIAHRWNETSRLEMVRKLRMTELSGLIDRSKRF